MGAPRVAGGEGSGGGCPGVRGGAHVVQPGPVVVEEAVHDAADDRRAADGAEKYLLMILIEGIFFASSFASISYRYNYARVPREQLHGRYALEGHSVLAALARLRVVPRRPRGAGRAAAAAAASRARSTASGSGAAGRAGG